ncbi:exodeoxyribonuclease III [Acidiphilium sp. PA]|uniref:exodeoxyribonuclease III n=1 Tax=Acidiphilium sp. PA TaxID=2871705 RepID=UPI0022434ED1|nr:exodeoxyribonuclease III [Acidiphilium sp. PA]MCW8308331.1 exodeoxyribonuclease III [Acidiphilium sp. PA]
MTRTLTVATWNINSVRLRQDLLTTLMAKAAPDILCLQETKAPDFLFPSDLGNKLGLPHVLTRGMKGYNGVAVLSRFELQRLETTPDWCGKSDCRHIAANVLIGHQPITIHNFYVPAGGDIPDREANPKYGHKLDFITEAKKHFASCPPYRTILVGDLNIAPLENDVWNHKQLLGVVSHTPAETAGLNEWREQGFTDAIRHFVSQDQKLFTWWSYRNRDWRASNRGRRLDHIWVSRDLEASLSHHDILSEARDWPRGSDHVPVVLTLAI